MRCAWNKKVFLVAAGKGAVEHAAHDEWCGGTRSKLSVPLMTVIMVVENVRNALFCAVVGEKSILA